MRALTQARRVANLFTNQASKQIRLRQGASRVPESTFDELLDRHAAGHSKVFLHVGLSDIKAAFDTNPYEFLLERLDERFESILAPGFTDYFKISGVYHKQYSRPKHGTFVRLFHEDADYRTDDAIKSILVKGPYRFDGCDHHRSYHDDGCFAQLVRDDALVLNVGTPWLKCSHLHYLEHQHGAPYVIEKTYDGVLYRSSTEYEHIEQTCSVYSSKFYSWNRRKLTRRLERAGVIDRYDLNGLKTIFFTLDDIVSVIGDEMRRDPHYLVTL